MSLPPDPTAGAAAPAVSQPSSPLLRLVLAPLRVVVAVVVVLDELARPIYRPLARWFGSLALIRRAEAVIAGLPPYAVLAVISVPFVGVEPLKILALYWIGMGQWISGLLLLGFAYLASFLLVERIYEAGHAQLMRIGWFKSVMDFVVRIRDAVLAWARQTSVWIYGHRLALAARAVAAGVTARVRRMLGRDPPPTA